MTDYAQPSSTYARPRSRPVTMVSFYLHGAVAGLIGAVTLALWFFYLDIGRGQPLHTPTVLGTALFRGGAGLEAAETLPPSASLTMLFTIVHGAVFMVMGMAAARLVHLLEAGRNLALAAVLLFLLSEFGFLAFAMTTSITVELMAWPEVLLGNALAATTMVTYLWRRRPERRQAREIRIS